MTKVKDLAAKNQKTPDNAGTKLVKDLISKTMSKSGKVKAIKVKVKFGGGKTDKSKKKAASHNPAAHKDV